MGRELAKAARAYVRLVATVQDHNNSCPSCAATWPCDLIHPSLLEISNKRYAMSAACPPILTLPPQKPPRTGGLTDFVHDHVGALEQEEHHRFYCEGCSPSSSCPAGEKHAHDTTTTYETLRSQLTTQREAGTP